MEWLEARETLQVKKDLEKALEEMEGKEKEEKKSVSPTRLNTILNTSNAPRKTKEESPEVRYHTHKAMRTKIFTVSKKVWCSTLSSSLS